jgi:hypothetical protein
MLRGRDFVKQHVEEARFQNFDAIFYRRTERKTREGRDGISDRVIALDPQNRTAVALDRPDDQHQENEGPSDEG